MTTDINMDLQIPVHPLPTGCDVAVGAEHYLADIALVALIRGFGPCCAPVDLDTFHTGGRALSETRAVVARSTLRLHRARAAAPGALLIGIGVGAGEAFDAVVLPDAAASALQLRAVLGDACTHSTSNHVKVHLSERERDVLSTYVLGATVYETARHHFISESTVRTHFRRVVTRYGNAGRTVNNKSQLLIELIADGWLDRDNLGR